MLDHVEISTALIVRCDFILSLSLSLCFLFPLEFFLLKFFVLVRLLLPVLGFAWTYESAQAHAFQPFQAPL